MRKHYTIKGRYCIASVSKYRYRIYSVDRIWVAEFERGQGLARSMMAQILADADAAQITLRLLVVPLDGLKYEALVAWYERCGFVQDEILTYYREPVPLLARAAHFGVLSSSQQQKCRRSDHYAGLNST